MCTFFVMTVLSLILETYEWDTLKDYAKKYENDRDSGTRSLISGINRNYFEPYVMELVFEFTVNANTMIERQIRRMGSIQDDVEETMAGELYADGYIATSQIGDFALLHRLKGAVNNLVMGKAASQGLDQWLFDINKARTPQEIKKISTWQNSDINEKQKEAVEKILSVPDVCLIQGPPGTGKTTVIAEAIYQLVMAQWASAYAEAALGLSKTMGDLLGPCLFAVSMGISRILYGKYGEKVDLSKFMLGSGALCVVCYVLASLFLNPVVGLTGCILCGFSVGIMWPGTLSISSKKFPAGGTAMFALLAMAGDLGGSIGPGIVGRVTQMAGDNIRSGMLVGLIFPVVMVIGLLFFDKIKSR